MVDMVYFRVSYRRKQVFCSVRDTGCFGGMGVVVFLQRVVIGWMSRDSD